jgi:hypothetical protein
MRQTPTVPPSPRLLELLRVAYREEGTFGVLLDRGRARDLSTAGEPFAVTLELPWRDNRPRESCIPTGEYVCRRVKSPRFGDTFEVAGVPGRSHILFHAGNWITDSLGCILTAEQFERLEGRMAVAHSGKGFAEFLARLAGESAFDFMVRDA